MKSPAHPIALILWLFISLAVTVSAQPTNQRVDVNQPAALVPTLAAGTVSLPPSPFAPERDAYAERCSMAGSGQHMDCQCIVANWDTIAQTINDEARERNPAAGIITAPGPVLSRVDMMGICKSQTGASEYQLQDCRGSVERGSAVLRRLFPDGSVPDTFCQCMGRRYGEWFVAPDPKPFGTTSRGAVGSPALIASLQRQCAAEVGSSYCAQMPVLCQQ